MNNQQKETRPEAAATVRGAQQEVTLTTSNSTPAGAFRQAPAVENIIPCEKIESAAQKNRFVALRISGDCLEASDVCHGDIVFVDFQRMPRVPLYKGHNGEDRSDLCLCLAQTSNMPAPIIMAKRYVGKWGPWHMVGTDYRQKQNAPYRMNWAVRAIKVYGVLCACLGEDGNLKWSIDTQKFPTALPESATICGGNVGDPIPLSSEQGRKIQRRLREACKR